MPSLSRIYNTLNAFLLFLFSKIFPLIPRLLYLFGSTTFTSLPNNHFSHFPHFCITGYPSLFCKDFYFGCYLQLSSTLWLCLYSLQPFSLLLSNSLLTAWLCLFCSNNYSAAAINGFSHGIRALRSPYPQPDFFLPKSTQISLLLSLPPNPIEEVLLSSFPLI